MSSAGSHAIAIVGMGCRFPGGIEAPGTYWKALKKGVDAIREAPPERWNVQRYYDESPAARSAAVTRWGGFLPSIDRFDAAFFGISPREGRRMDPQQRLLLEVSWEALEDSGIVPAHLAGSSCGVFVGVYSQEWWHLQVGNLERSRIDSFTNTGGAASITANRISHVLDLRGPSLAVDTACSSSLVALHMACQSLIAGESAMAIAGGVNLLLDPGLTIGFSKAGMLSPDGRCKAFDAKANGYVRSEGAGAVILKPVARAQADGDRIYAVILGTGTNSDGHTNPITFPSRTAQEALLRHVYARAAVDPKRVGYIEAHGTGTRAGDRAEAEALGTVLGRSTGRDKSLTIGSVKTNIGHLESAAGMAGLIKLALAIYHREIPATLHFTTPNPEIDFHGLGLAVAGERSIWEPDANGCCIGGVNSFGFGGSNAHAVLASAPEPTAVPKRLEVASAGDGPRMQLLPVSAHTEEALELQTLALVDFLAEHLELPLGDICYTAGARRQHHEHRLAFVAEDAMGLIEGLSSFDSTAAAVTIARGRVEPHASRNLVFVYTGMGPQWYAMGRQLFAQEPTFRRALEECEKVFAKLAGWSLLDELLRRPEADSRMNDTSIAQPANFFLQVGLTSLLRSWGIVPSAIIGHSAGECAAGYAAGVYDLNEATRIIYHRSALQQRLSGLGCMVALGLRVDEVRKLLRGHPGGVEIASVNSPAAVTLAGDRRSLESFVAPFEKQHVFCRFLRGEVPYHSSLMNPIERELRQALRDLRPRLASTTLYSTTMGGRSGGSDWNAEYWWNNVRNPVLFAAAIGQMLIEGHGNFLEIGPHPVLATSIAECAADFGVPAKTLPSLKRGDNEHRILLGSVAELYCAGHAVNWEELHTGSKFVPLPNYVRSQPVLWVESSTSRDVRTASEEHPLLGLRSTGPELAWSNQLDTQRTRLAWLHGHRIQSDEVYPGAAYVEMAAVAIDSLEDTDDAIVLEDVTFERPLVLGSNEDPHTRVTLDRERECFEVQSQTSGRPEWVLHARGTYRRATEPAVEPKAIKPQPAEPEAPESDPYARFEKMGLHYSGPFRGIRRCRTDVSRKVAYAEIELDPALEMTLVHPAVLDCCFQAMLSLESLGVGTALLPVRIERMRIHRQLTSARAQCRARLKRQRANELRGDLVLWDADGQLVAEVTNVTFRGVVDAQGPQAKPADNLYQPAWERAERVASTAAGGVCVWIVCSDVITESEAVLQVIRNRGETTIALNWRDATRDGAAAAQPNVRALLDQCASRGHKCRVVYICGADPSPSLAVDEIERRTVDRCVQLASLAGALGTSGHEIELAVVTAGAHDVGDTEMRDGRADLSAAAVVGFLRTVQNEFPRLQCRSVDVAPTMIDDDRAELIAELADESGEPEVALRDGGRWVARFARASGAKPPCAPSGEASIRLTCPVPGNLQNLGFIEEPRRLPGKGEVEVAVHASGLNFKDVLKALGLLSSRVLEGGIFDHDLGMEFAGVVTAVGADVADVRVGDRVMGFARHALSSFVVTRAELVTPISDRLGFTEAAVIPMGFVTAAYALEDMGRIQRGERVLIHNATGGVGEAALQIAQSWGAEVFATAGTPEKRERLRVRGVRDVMDSHSLDFADRIMTLTDGAGVDIVLNAIPGHAIARGLSVLGAYGRFVEIGKRDIDRGGSISLAPFNENLSFVAVDIDRLIEQRPKIASSVLRRVGKRIETGELVPPPTTVFSVSQAETAFNLMAHGHHIGKIALEFDDAEVHISTRAGPASVTFKPDATYLVTGGLGGMGLALAQWIVTCGGRHVVLASRRDDPGHEARVAITKLEASGAAVRLIRADVCHPGDVERLVADIGETLPPLKGVFHAAGVLRDELILQLEEEHLRDVLGPKLRGAWNLHRATETLALDHFVLFSSIAAVWGAPGQASYVAGNSFMDRLAGHRRSAGMPALSINLGAIADVGMLSRARDVGKYLARQGLRAMAPAQILRTLATVLGNGTVGPCVTIADVDWTLAQDSITTVRSPRFLPVRPSDVKAEGVSDAASTSAPDALAGLSAEERQATLERGLVEQISRVLERAANDIDRRRSIKDLGIDSLTSVDLKQRIERQFPETDVSMMLLLRGPTITELAAHLGANLRVPSVAATPAEEGGSEICISLQRGSNGGVPLFMVHPISGDSACFGELAQRLAARRPVYGFFSPGLRGGHLAESVEATAKQYVEAMRRLQPEGPYLIMGYSAGGTIAWEMGLQLARQEEEVGALTLVDAPLPPYPRRDDVALAGIFLEELEHQAAPQLRRLVTQLRGMPRQEVPSLLERACGAFCALRNRWRTFSGLMQALATYRPTSSAAPVLLLQASELPPRTLRDHPEITADGLGWRSVNHGCRVIKVVGDHRSILSSPHLDAVVEALAEELPKHESVSRTRRADANKVA